MRRLLSNASAIAGAVLGTAPLLWADALPPSEALTADIVFLGEQHDNPGHHALQAQWVSALQARALVFEMLTSDQAHRATQENRATEAQLEAALNWNGSGWPDFALYFPIFDAVPDAQIFGAAVPRSQLGDIMQKDLTEVAGPEITQRFALDRALPDAQLQERIDLQRTAHCDALPEDLLPAMVDVQRLRDAVIAEQALAALSATGGPVIVITGNGHAREDWGAPYLVAQASPETRLFTLGQGEAGQTPNGSFSAVVDGPAVDRGDPCAAFN